RHRTDLPVRGREGQRPAAGDVYEPSKRRLRRAHATASTGISASWISARSIALPAGATSAARVPSSSTASAVSSAGSVAHNPNPANEKNRQRREKGRTLRRAL